MYLDVFDLIIASFSVVLNSDLLLKVPQLFSGFCDFLRFILKVLIHQAAVEVVEDLEFNCSYLLQGLSLGLALLDVQEVYVFTVGSWHMG